MGRSSNDKRKITLALGLAGLSLLVVTLLAGTGRAQQSLPAPPISLPAGAALPPPLTPGPAPDLDLVVTAQVTGWIEPCG